MLSPILKGCLLQHHRDAGIELYEPDDHILILRCSGEVIATYASGGARIGEIRRDADEWLEQHKGGMT